MGTHMHRWVDLESVETTVKVTVQRDEGFAPRIRCALLNMARKLGLTVIPGRDVRIGDRARYHLMPSDRIVISTEKGDRPIG